MTPRQILALVAPCWRAPETAHPRYFLDATFKGARLRSCLTINKWLDAFEGEPVWHASVSLLGRSFASLARGERRIVQRYARELLAGVGLDPTKEGAKEVAFHVRRALSPEEQAALDPAWRALPALDRAG